MQKIKLKIFKFYCAFISFLLFKNISNYKIKYFIKSFNNPFKEMKFAYLFQVYDHKFNLEKFNLLNKKQDNFNSHEMADITSLTLLD